MKSALFLRVFLLHWPKRNCLSGRGCFTVQYQNGSFFFTTRGYGHGVGMSQWGARALAEQGQTAAQILAHYFPGTQLRQ